VRRPPARYLALALAVLAVGGAIPVLAASDGSVVGPAEVFEPAVRVSDASGPGVDVVSVYNVGPLRADVAARAAAASEAAGGTSAIGRAASTGMLRVRRGSATVQQAPSGHAFPMGTTILPLDAVVDLMGSSVAAVLTSTDIVMSEQTAGLRGARAGDVVDLVASDGTVLAFTIASVVPDEITGGTELLLSEQAGDRLGVSRESRMVLWGFDSRAELESELTRQGLVNTIVRLRRSWDPPDPDATLGMASTKAALGEFAYRVDASGSVSVDDAWRRANITAGSIGQLRLQTGCHRVARAALADAMDEVIASGLAGTIDYADANTFGGCFVPRFNRLTPDSSIGFLSRHSWGMAIDTNTQGSCQGCEPPDMDCRTVRIFRKHGFAWGGNFLRPDGMHFEWVGERRDIGLYPSRYCANLDRGQVGELGGDTARGSMFADDGLYVGDH